MKKAFGFSVAAMLLLTSAAWAKIGGGDITFRVKGEENVVYSHDTHVGKGLKCTDCHYALYTTMAKHSKATMADMQKGRSCGACHNGQKAFDVRGNCKRCHKK